MTVYTIDLQCVECCVCGVAFGIVKALYGNLRDNGGMFHCPNGHPQSFTKPRVRLLEERLAAQTAELDQAQARAREAEATLSKSKQRVGSGSCPCCKRHFKALRRHMEHKHPEYKKP